MCGCLFLAEGGAFPRFGEDVCGFGLGEADTVDDESLQGCRTDDGAGFTLACLASGWWQGDPVLSGRAFV